MESNFSPLLESAPSRSLVITANPCIRAKLRNILTNAGWEVDCCGKVDEFTDLANRRDWSLVLIIEKDTCDLSLEVLERLRLQIKGERTQVVVLSEKPSADDSMRCHEHGATNYLRWPILSSDILEIADEARRQTQPLSCEDENAVIRIVPVADRLSKMMIGGSPPMLRLLHQVFKIVHSPNNLSVLIAGETGAGKEIVAWQIHQASKCPGQFCAVNCANLGESLFESEMFGHEKGSFTGAQGMKKGLWEVAANGTLFLDEITEMAPNNQTKLLRVLQEGTFRRVGGNQEINATARIIAATNRDIEQAIRDGVFRQDLYYRLGEVVRIPPLRERVEDIPLLVTHFCQRAGKEMIIMPDAMNAIRRQKWIGNVRALEQFVNRIITYSGSRIHLKDIQQYLEPEARSREHLTRDFLLGLMNTHPLEDWPTVQEIRRRYVIEVFHEIGDAYKVSKILKIDYRTVNAILREEKLLPPESKGTTVAPLFPDEDSELLNATSE